MKTRSIVDLLLLAMLWGGSFLFMRMSVPEFGAIPMMTVRVVFAAIFLLPILIWKNCHHDLIKNIVPISIVGVIGSAIPFSLIAYSTLYFTAGFASVVNAATPMFTALIAFIWLGQKLSKIAVVGLLIGIVGVILLVWDKIGFDQTKLLIAIIAGIAATFFYGISANYAKKSLIGVAPIATTTGSLFAAGIALLPFAFYFWPSQMPSSNGWLNVFTLAIACTAFAQVLFFRLIENTGATNATTVTFLIPIFGLLWGNLFLNEAVELNTILAGVIILTGTGMTIGLIKGNFLKKIKLNQSA